MGLTKDNKTVEESPSSTKDYWKDWFDDRARNVTSDRFLNRGTKARLPKFEEEGYRQLFAAVNPSSDDILLDAGCGSGRNISLFHAHVRRIVGVDFSSEMLQKAGERVRSEGMANVELLQADVTALQFENHTFEKVVCASVLQYLDDDDCAQALREMMRVCKPGGRVVLHVKNGTSLYALSLSLARKVATLLGRRVKPEFYRSRAWHENVLTGAGGRVIDYDGFGIITFAPCPSFLTEWLLAFERLTFGWKPFKRFAVNYKLTVGVPNVSAS